MSTTKKTVEILYAGFLEGHKDAVYALAHGSEPRYFFSAGGDGMVIRWDMEKKGEGEVMAQLPTAVYSLLYFQDSNILVAGCRFGGVYVLDLTSHKQVLYFELAGDVFDLCHLPERQVIAAACAGGYLYFLSENSFEILKEIHPTENHGRVVALTPDGGYLASGWSDGQIRIYDTIDFSLHENFVAHQPSVFSLLYTDRGRQLVSGGRDAQLRSWQTEPTYAEEETIPAHLFTINNIIPIPELKLMATASRDKTIKIWDINSLELLKVIDRTKLPAHSHSVNKLLWLPAYNYLVSAGDDKVLRIWGIICG